ncbi:MAG: DUF427 domain-containing protein [Gemmatimonadales bacterium]|nr:MAG: DUF427 domain-containing protein [Gemmatimonadales bacterium]
MSSRRIPPGPGQESVWDYPRPPRLERTSRRLEVIFNGERIADTTNGWRVLETSHPPVYYLPPGDIRQEFLRQAGGGSHCEWKGTATYWDVVREGRVAQKAAWSYPDPTPAFAPIRDHLAFYPGPMDECRVDGEIVTPQQGGFYGGWITSDLVGPFKGEPGSWGW